MNGDRPSRVPLSKLDIGMLTALHALLSERGVSRAARKLGLSQPSMSNALTRLRLAFDDPLLIRTGQEMVLTERAVEILPRLATIIQQLVLLEQRRNFDPATATLEFRIGVTDHSAAVVMPAAIALLRREAPGIRVMTMPADGTFADVDASADSSPHLRMHWTRAAPPDWHVRRLLDEKMVVIGRKGHPDLLKPLSLERFLEIDQVTPSPNNSGFQTQVDVELGKLGLKRKVVASLAHFASLPPVVRGTDLIALFPERLLKALHQDDMFELVDPPFPLEPFTTSLAWHPRYHHDQAHRWLRELIARAAAQGSR